MESLGAGVPMLCWPFFADCWFSENNWGIGTEIQGDADRVEIERLVSE